MAEMQIAGYLKGPHSLLEAAGLKSLSLTFSTLSRSWDYAGFLFFSERFTLQDIAVGVHQSMATCSVSCLLSGSSQPSCCPCCFFFFSSPSQKEMLMFVPPYASEA